MNRAKLKNYAPQARRDFIQAVTDRAAYYGLTPKKTEPIIEKGDVALIGGRAFPRDVAQKRKSLEERISRHGFEQVMETMAYTWFNRLVAIRFMELHGYLDHGYRVLSHPKGKTIPEILEHAEHIDLPGIDKNKVIELKLEGTKEEELYRMLLIAQCNALHMAMPFLFEWINDETELLLPNNLLHSDSLIRKLINEIDEEDWQEVEIIGWLYESYISEKKDEVIGKVVRSEDIPAATQRFTPNWIVKYLVQNSLGRQWLATYPNSPLRQQMAYYIEPPEQTLEVQAQLKSITPESLNPEEITFLDDACGSGHILVEAYDLFKLIYQERGYRAKAIPRLILEKNLYGLEIDDRAAQLASLALMMKARADDHRILSSYIQPNVLAIQESKGLNAKEITKALNSAFERGEKEGEEGYISQTDIGKLVELFENGKTFGSLIRVPEALTAKLSTINERVKAALACDDLIIQAEARVLLPLVQQSLFLANRYKTVITNPPYMGSKFYNFTLKQFVKQNFKDVQGDLFSCFIKRNIDLTHKNGFLGMITIPNWMFLSTFEVLRIGLLENQTIDSFIHNGRGVWGSDFGSCSFVIRNVNLPSYNAIYKRLFDKQGSVASIEELQQRFFESKPFFASAGDFKRIPGNPIAYWASDGVKKAFNDSVTIGEVSFAKFGMSTGNSAYIRAWQEVPINKIGFQFDSPSNFNMHQYWAPYDKGGPFRKWFGNQTDVVFWKENGKDIRNSENSAVRNSQFFCRPHVSWTLISSSLFAVRFFEKGFLLDTASNALYEHDREFDLFLLIAFLNTKVVFNLLSILNPSINFSCGVIGLLPIKRFNSDLRKRARGFAEECISLAETDWNSFETSWNFRDHPLVRNDCRAESLDASWNLWLSDCKSRFERMWDLETENNRLFIKAYGLQGELSPEVPQDQITLTQPDRGEDIKRLISYGVGCMMGRYTLDKPGLIYAHSGNKGFDSNQYKTFPADPDGIIPFMEGDWFHDDASNRLIEFIGVAWPKEYLEENLKFIVESLDPNRNGEPRKTIRRYLANGFFKDHLKTYKRRPIYWLFSSGNQRAFQCLVYLHRYNESTLSRMRTEYVIPLQGKIASRIEQLADEIQNATSTSHRKKMEKERDTLIKQQAELQSFDEKLRHYADLRISLDLDDGVKVNYGKFGDLLAEVKTVTGGSDE